MKIIKLESENIKRIKAVEIQPGGSLVIIGGQNAQGKSSVLDSIEYALAGGSSIPSKPIRKGEKKARVIVDLGNIIVTRTFTDSGTKLVVSDKEGFTKSSPQQLLDSLTGKLSFDPLAFSRMDSKKQLETLKNLIGIDFSKLDEEKEKIYQERTQVNKEIKSLQAQIQAIQRYDDIPSQEISVIGLINDLEIMDDHNRQIERQKENFQHILDKLTESDKLLEILRKEIKMLREKWDIASNENESLRILMSKKGLEIEGSIHIDTITIRTQIAQADEINTKVRSNIKRTELEFDIDAGRRLSEEFTGKLEEIEKKKSNLITSSNILIPGLLFDENGITHNGIPFDQCSSAEQLRVSVAMGFAMNPKLKILLIRDGSLLDENGLKTVAKMAGEADGQLWLERVGEGKECQVIIEDGRVKDE